MDKEDGQPSSLLACIQVSHYKTAFTAMHLVFLELDTHHCQLLSSLMETKRNYPKDILSAATTQSLR